MFLAINGHTLLQTLQILGIGMFSIFLVMGILFGCIKLLNKITNKKQQ